MSSKVGLAVFGMGRMGFQHVKNILMSPRASLQWIVCENIDDALKVKAEYNLPTKCTTPDNAAHALDDSSVDAVMVVSPTATHETLIKQSLGADKAVFCEKPLTSEVGSTHSCYDLAASSKQPLLCAFHRRFDPSIYKTYQSVRSGTNGPVRIIKSTSRDFPFPPTAYLKTSGGIFKDSTIHDLDMCAWIAGARPQTVFAQGNAFNGELRDFGDHDQVVVVVTYQNGVISINDNGRLCPFGYDQRLEVLCDKSMLNIDNRGIDFVTSSGSEVTSQPRIEENFMNRYPEAYRNELDHFLDVVQGKAELRVTRQDTLQAMRLAELCHVSITERKTVEYSD